MIAKIALLTNKAHVAHARGIAMYVAEREIDGFTLQALAKLFHLDRSTVFYWVRTVESNASLHMRAIIVQTEYERIPHPEAVEDVDDIIKEMCG